MVFEELIMKNTMAQTTYNKAANNSVAPNPTA
jgi:hypothetical protein